MANEGKVLDRGRLGTMCTMFFILISAVGLFEFRIHPSLQGFDLKVNDVIRAGRYPERPDIAIRTRYVGVGGIDYALSFIVAMFLPGAVAFNEEQQVQMMYFLFTVLSIVAVFSVEAHRTGSYRAWVSYTSVLAALYQSTGGAVIFPIWFLLFMRHSAQTSLYESSSIYVPISYAKALVPGHILGYLVLTIASFLPLKDPGFSTRQALVALWQPSPIYVNILIVILAQIYSTTNRPTAAANSDVRYIKSLHASCFITSLMAHTVLIYRWTQSTWSMADIFIPRMSLLQGSVPQVVYYIFQVDFAICFIVALLATYIVLMDLKLLNRCDMTPIMVGSSIVLGTFLIGPGATISAAWWWREEKLRSSGNRMRKGKNL